MCVFVRVFVACSARARVGVCVFVILAQTKKLREIERDAIFEIDVLVFDVLICEVISNGMSETRADVWCG